MLARAKALHAEIGTFSAGQSLLDAQPRIEESSDVLLYKLGDRQPWHGFLDGKGLTSVGNGSLSKMQREIDIVSKLQIFIDLGYKWSVFVYTYRSILKTLPQIESAQQANKDEVYCEYYNVLLPAISSMRFLKDFTVQACDYLCEVLDLVQAQPDLLASEQLLLQLIRLMDTLLVIDSIKSARGALNNDFSFYKRAEKEVMRFDRSVPDKSLENAELYVAQCAALCILLSRLSRRAVACTGARMRMRLCTTHARTTAYAYLAARSASVRLHRPCRSGVVAVVTLRIRSASACAHLFRYTFLANTFSTVTRMMDVVSKLRNFERPSTALPPAQVHAHAQGDRQMGPLVIE